MMHPTKYIYVVQVTRQLSIDIINVFVKKGAKIKLITGLIESNYADLDPSVEVVYHKKYDNSSGFKRVYTWLYFTISSFFHILFKGNKSELILVTTPPFIIYFGIIFKKLRNQKYHLVIWDLYPDVLVSFNVFKDSSLIIRVWKKLNKNCFQAASNVFTLGKHLQSAVMNYTAKEPVIIQNWTNADFIKPLQKNNNPFALQYNLADKFVVMYSGNLGITHDIESIIYAAEKLKNNSAIQFVIIGGGAKKEKIKQMVMDLKLTNVLLLPYQDKEVLPYTLSCADIGVVTLDKGAENISVPSKVYYLLAAGSVILALSSKKSELGLLIDRYKCGKIIDDASVESIAEFILHLNNNKSDLEKYKIESRKASFDFTVENAKIYFEYISNQKLQ